MHDMNGIFVTLLVFHFALLIPQAIIFHGYVCPRLKSKGWTPSIWNWGFYADIKAFRRLCCEHEDQDELSAYYFLIILHILSLIVVIAMFAYVLHRFSQ